MAWEPTFPSCLEVISLPYSLPYCLGLETHDFCRKCFTNILLGLINQYVFHGLLGSCKVVDSFFLVGIVGRIKHKYKKQQSKCLEFLHMCVCCIICIYIYVAQIQ